MSAQAPILLLAQVDDASGEVLGFVLDELTRVGAKNVQLLSTIGKKGRPGHVLLVDVDPADEEDVAALLVGELGIWGYRVLESTHKHFEIRRYQVRLELQLGDGAIHQHPLRLKRILAGGVFVRAKAEYDDLVAITAVHEHVPVAVLKSAVETAIGASEPGDVLRVALAVPAKTTF
ncbi:MAG TPA: nickel insertion protein [Flexivirga sp.]|uniref:nickel insertion protein n=1 Tax=Flexivirga sp. TaxID=1962927 RepID=UPI002C8D267A|nr:nickel insertion protein [Flexivirga sp.]HWC24164.1 nickel insertion protein [Flexivirga sp.]